MGESGTDYGYERGSYGRLDSGSFPGDLFGDTNSRDVDAIYEDADGFWSFTYRGGLAGDWNTDTEHLNEIVVEVTYEDNRDPRWFVLGGFVDSLQNRIMKLAPPLPSRDWADRDGPDRDYHHWSM